MTYRLPKVAGTDDSPRDPNVNQSLNSHSADPNTSNDVKSRVIVNALANWLGYAAAGATAFFMSPILVHRLGDTRFGIWTLVDSVLAYLALADLGVGAAVLRYVAKFEGIRDHGNLNRIFNSSLSIIVLGGIVALVVTLGIAFLFANPLGVTDELVGDARWLLTLLGINLAIGLPLGIYGTVLSALRRYPLKAGIRIVVLLVRSGLLLWVLHCRYGIPGVAIVVTACSLGENLIWAWAAHHLLPSLKLTFRFVDRDTLKSIFGYSSFVFIALIAGRVSFQSDAIVLASFLSPECITYFAIAANLRGFIVDSITTLTTVLTPAVSNLEARGDHSGIREVLSTGTRYVLYLVMPVQIGGLMFGYPFLSLWMGPRYADLCYVTLAILLAPLPITLSKNVSLRVLHGLGKVKLYSAFTVAEAIVNLGLSIILVRSLMRVEGTALGTAIPAVIQSFAVTALACRTVGFNPFSHYYKTFARPLLAASVVLLAWMLPKTMVSSFTWGTLLVYAGLGIVPYLIAVCVLEPSVRRTLSRIVRLESKNKATSATAVSSD